MTIRDMVTRHSDFDETKDFIPTPPWATRVLYESVAPSLKAKAPTLKAWDPACGHGHMLDVFDEYRHMFVCGSDIVVAKRAEKPGRMTWEQDFTKATDKKADAIITNPPYRFANEFIANGLKACNFGMGLLMRVQVLEGQARYRDVWSKTPPTQIAIFSDRIPFKTGVVVRKAPKMFLHCWLWWEKTWDGALLPPRPPMWIRPDAQQAYEKDSDYE
jgi:hypothetical protein